MGIGIIGKANGVRFVTGSVHYGERKREAFNIEHREFPDKVNNRTVIVLGQTLKRERIIIPATPAKKPRKTAIKKKPEAVA